MEISKIDKNLGINNSINEKDIVYYNVKNQPFTCYGFFDVNEQGFTRLPDSLAKSVSEGVHALSKNTAGGRVKFRTNSKCVAVYVKMPYFSSPYMTMISSCGFDMYVDNKFNNVFVPQIDFKEKWEHVQYFRDDKLREITLNFPLYNSVEELYVGLEKGAVLEKTKGYKHEKPIVFYGSSITQGSCAGRPGLNYESHLSRWLDSDFINLGFSGHALGEQEMASYISNLDMSLFVLDYDHNAPTPEHLYKTHYNFYKTIRNKNKDLPIIMMTRPDFENDLGFNHQRRQAVKDTYTRALNEGDDNVYFVDGESLFGKENRIECTLDSCHPNDLGYYRIAKTLYPIIKKVIRK